MLLRRAIMGNTTPPETYLRILTNVFSIPTLPPYIMVLPTFVTVTFDVLVRAGASNNSTIIFGKNGSSPAVTFDNDAGNDATVLMPYSNFLTTLATATGVGDFRGKKKKSISITLGTSGLMTLSVDGVQKDSVSGAAQTAATFSTLFWRNAKPASEVNPDILINNLKVVTTVEGLTIDMPLNGDFTNNGLAPLNPIVGVAGVDYEFVVE